MFRLLTLAVLQSALLASGQVLLKLALQRVDVLRWSWACFAGLATNGWLALAGAAFTVSGLLWVYLLRHFPLSVVYPLSSMSYVAGALAAVLVFREHIPATRWLGLALVMAGVALIAQRP